MVWCTSQITHWKVHTLYSVQCNYISDCADGLEQQILCTFQNTHCTWHTTYKYMSNCSVGIAHSAQIHWLPNCTAHPTLHTAHCIWQRPAGGCTDRAAMQSAIMGSRCISGVLCPPLPTAYCLVRRANQYAHFYIRSHADKPIAHFGSTNMTTFMPDNFATFLPTYRPTCSPICAHLLLLSIFMITNLQPCFNSLPCYHFCKVDQTSQCYIEN